MVQYKNIPDLSEDTTPLINDYIETYDSTSSSNVKVSLENLLKLVSSTNNNTINFAMFSPAGLKIIDLIGTNDIKVTGQSGNYSSNLAIGNNHAGIQLNSLTGTGTATVTGTSISESTLLPVTGDTEVITIDSVANYQTIKKWHEISAITFSGGISAINYDISNLGYDGRLNQNFQINGYRCDIQSSSANANIAFKIVGVEDLGNNKFQLNTLEHIGFTTSTNTFVDNLRTGGDDRSYTGSGTLMPNNGHYNFKQFDFDTYFSSDENIISGGDSNSGIIISIVGEPDSGNIAGIASIAFSVYYQYI